MKTSRYLLLFCCSLLFWQVGAKAQSAPVAGAENGAVAYADITAFVISPIGITKVKDMFFGTIVTGNAGSITLPPIGEVPTTTGNVTMKSGQGILSAASFEVNDGLGSTPTATRYFTGYSISLPHHRYRAGQPGGQDHAGQQFYQQSFRHRLRYFC